MSHQKIKKTLGFSHEKDLTEQEILEAARRRVALIDKEFTETFKFVMKYPKTVTVFGSARSNDENPHYKKAEELAKKIAEMGYTIVTGGGPGIMEAANRGASEANQPTVGLNIKLPHEQSMNPYTSDHLDYYYFFARKVALTFAAEAFIFFPGGFGTLNEFFEIMTLMQTKKMPVAPVILVGSDFWESMDEFLRETLLDTHEAIDEADMSLYTITDDDAKILELIKKAPIIENINFPEEYEKLEQAKKS